MRQKLTSYQVVNMMCQKFIFLAVLLLCFHIFVPVKCLFSDQTLYIYEEPSVNFQNQRSIMINTDEDIATVKHRQKRSITSFDSANKKQANITIKTTPLNVSHEQIAVHWIGEQTNVIVCLSKGPIKDSLTGKIVPSAVYISYNNGDTYDNKTDLFKIDDETYATIDKIYYHPKYNTHMVFTDTKNNILFTTVDHGRNINMIQLNFKPSDISFHQYKPLTFATLDKSDKEKRLRLTEDFGQNWRVIQYNVINFVWHSFSLDDEDIHLFVQRSEPTGLSSVISSQNLFDSENKERVLAEEVKDFQIKGDFIFVTKYINNTNNLDLYISYKNGLLTRCLFDSNLNRWKYYIADITGSRVMVVVSHTDKLSHLYISEDINTAEIETTDTVHFKLSLERIFGYFPNITWKYTWFRRTTKEAFADVYKVEGLTGIYIASQVSTKVYGDSIGPKSLMSLITYDYGVIWQPLNAPKYDNEGQPTLCRVNKNCSLHLGQKFTSLYPNIRTPIIFSSKAAPGIIMANGVMGKSLNGHYGVYISTDAGITWKMAFKGIHFFSMGDHGGILVAVQYFKRRRDTRYVMYSTDEGENWIKQSFHNKNLKIYNLMTEPDENSTIFTMFGSEPEPEHQWIAFKLDFQNIFSYHCKDEDYKLWSPSQSDGHRLIPCVKGMQQTFERRIPHSNCYNGEDYKRPIKLKPCTCDAEDYECDLGFHYIEGSSYCVKNKSILHDPYAVPKTCTPGQFYNQTKGYRKIEDNGCKEGFTYLYEPSVIPCPINETEEFLLIAKRNKIIRVNLLNNEIEDISIQGLTKVITVDFDMKNNCLYWADSGNNTIGRQCNKNGTNYSEILVESGLQSIEGLALDWISNVLYFVDGQRAKIEIIRTDISYMDRMRKTIVPSKYLKKPRGIAVHPIAGYIFWTDWGESSVSRANMGGSDIKKLFDDSVVQWPNGISIDYIADRIYWVDAKYDYIASSDLHGTKFRKILHHDERVAHPYAIAIFKDTMYWNDWKRNGIFSADKDFGVNIKTIKESLPELMDLKVFAHSLQKGRNSCSNKIESQCEYICLGAPNRKHECLCPYDLTNYNGKCMCSGSISPNANFTCPKIENSCGSEYFACNNELCIPQIWTCDGKDDCGDNSDEFICETNTCKPNMFSCGDGKCIPQNWKCDFENDCSDKSDEQNCESVQCEKYDFTCKNKKCIPATWRCDHTNDCGDGSDEDDCKPNVSVSSQNNMSYCASEPLHSIPASWLCDGEIDCTDKSDESNCSNINCIEDDCPTVTCPAHQFSCTDGVINCVSYIWVCDGEADCVDESDELDCSKHICLKEEFACDNGKQCIFKKWACDGDYDCSDRSDESNCITSTTNTTIIATPNILLDNQANNTQT